MFPSHSAIYCFDLAKYYRANADKGQVVRGIGLDGRNERFDFNGRLSL